MNIFRSCFMLGKPMKWHFNPNEAFDKNIIDFFSIRDRRRRIIIHYKYPEVFLLFERYFLGEKNY